MALTAVASMNIPLLEGGCDLAVAKGQEPAANVRTAISAFGGLSKIIKPGNTVGLLTNTAGTGIGSFTHPEIITAVADMCVEAGAAKIHWMDWWYQFQVQYYKPIPLTDEPRFNFNVVDLKQQDLWQTIDVPRGKSLKKVRVCKALYEPDVMIFVPIAKHHASTGYTGALKLAMGTSHREDNVELFHKTEQLEQCIADLNTAIRRPDLIVMDAMEVITNRGPMGPGPMVKPQKVIVGKDAVAIDSYCLEFHGKAPADQEMITASAVLGVGSMELNKLNIREISR